MARRLDVVVAEVGGLTRSRAAALIKDGRVTVQGAVVTRPAAKVREGEVVDVDVPPPAPLEAQPQDLPLTIVHEDDDIVVVDKASGMVVHPGPGHPDGTLVNALLHHCGGLAGIGGVVRPGIVHRLDRDTSGLIVAAKNDAAHHHLAAQFADHSAGRRYLALCAGKPSSARGTIRTHLARHAKDRIRYASTDGSWGKVAVTHWERIRATDSHSLIGCRLETGRTHQVRVHLAELGLPLLGDPLYNRRGRGVSEDLREAVTRTMLHARELHLTHPTSGQRMVFEALPPRDFLAVQVALRL